MTTARSNDLTVRKSTHDDVPQMLAIYARAKEFMARTGNASQWHGEYPSASLLHHDISSGVSHVIESEGRIAGTFAFITGSDPTYSEIEGRWVNDEPYGTIHRIASDGTVGGIADCCLRYCTGIIGNIRIDTHRDNHVMLRWIIRAGFTFCGVIHIADGSPRLAFQLVNAPL